MCDFISELGLITDFDLITKFWEVSLEHCNGCGKPTKNKYTEEDIIKMLEFLVDNIFVVFVGKVFEQIIGIPMSTNCAPLLADIFLYSYEFIQSLLSAGKKRLTSQFNFTYRYIDDVLSINNPDFENYLGQMYPPELEIKDTTESNTSAWICSCQSVGTVIFALLFTTNVTISISILQIFRSWVATSLLRPPMAFLSHKQKRGTEGCSKFKGPETWQVQERLVSTLEHMQVPNSSDTPGLAPLMNVILRAMRLSNKLLGQGYVKERLKSSLRKFYGRYGGLTKQYEVPLSRMLHDILEDDHIQWHPPLIGHRPNFWPLLIWTLLPNLTFYLIVQGFHRTYATGAACKQRTLTPLDT